MYGTEVMKGGQIIRRSRNLRGMRDYARVSPVALVESMRDRDNQVRGLLIVDYADGARSVASFASYHVMVDWIRNRRTWRNALQVFHDEPKGYLTRPGIIAGE